MRGLIFDPFAGISGDMILGALVDVGLGPEWLEAFVESLGFEGVGVRIDRIDRSGIECTKVDFELPPEGEDAHRHLSDVLEVVEESGAPGSVRLTAARAFQELAEAEAAIHGIPVEGVHFHEVGALDAILDVMCAMAGLAELDVERCYVRPIAVGTGTVRIAHGEFPLPAPATLKLLEGLPVRETGYEGECTTPTGAAILRALDVARAPMEFVAVGSGYGAGSRDPEDRPNCLRVVMIDAAATSTGASGGERVYVVQADVDDMPPEYVPLAREALRDAGALDVVGVALAMKKGRPGLRIEALVPESRRESVLEALFRTTTTIGARYWPVARPSLRRSEETIEWRGRRIRRKRVRLSDGTERVKPEFDDVVAAAAALGLAPWEVRLALEGTDTGSDDVDDS
ncbi:MAG: nickel pincer cofactor biosynthesis protein LarC [Gemmatimonadota bacterium]